MIACGGATYFAQPDALKVNKREKERERERERVIFFTLLGFPANFVTRCTPYTFYWCTKVCNQI